METQLQKPKIGGWLYAIGFYLAYRVIIIIAGFVFAYRYISAEHYAFYLKEMFFSAPTLFLIIMLIWSIVAFCKKHRAFPYILGSLLIYQISSNIFNIWSMINEMIDYGEFIPSTIFFKFLLHIGIAGIIGLYLLLSDRVKQTFTR